MNLKPVGHGRRRNAWGNSYRRGITQVGNYAGTPAYRGGLIAVAYRAWKNAIEKLKYPLGI